LAPSEIRSLEVFVLVHRLRRERGPSTGTYRTRESVLVKVMDAEGAGGWGETYLLPGVTAALRELATLVVGRRPEGFRGLWHAVAAACENPYATSAVAIALEDLRARRAGLPVSGLYGGAVRERVRAYASSGGYYPDAAPEATWPDECRSLVEHGFGAIKLRIGRHPPERELPLLAGLRADLPAGVDLIADGNGAMTLPAAVAVGRRLGELGFLWFEEPLPQRDGYVAYERLRDELTVALGAGELLASRGAALDFLRRGCADIVQPDPTICGGIGELLFYAELAALHGVRCIPHVWGGGVALAAALQALAALPQPTPIAWASAPLLEYDESENPLRTEVLVDPIRLEAGDALVPGGPGLGVEVDEGWVRAHASG
jgi:D-galactarolactone cycloisomerase